MWRLGAGAPHLVGGVEAGVEVEELLVYNWFTPGLHLVGGVVAGVEFEELLAQVDAYT